MTDYPTVNKKHRSALQRAIGNGFIQTVTWILSVRNLDLNQLSKDGYTPMDIALDKADSLRMIALSRWDRFATTTPKNRQGSDYDELFWTPRWNPNVASFKLSKFVCLRHRTR